MLEEKETQLTLSRITTMVSQIRSHFVFNILNAISGMCKYDPAKADDTVLRFARYLRSNIDILEDDRPLPFAAVLRHLEDYAYLEQVASPFLHGLDLAKMLREIDPNIRIIFVTAFSQYALEAWQVDATGYLSHTAQRTSARG